MKSLSLPKLSLKGAVNKLENAIITVSGPAIAISGIIAGIDLLTGGSMFKDVRWLSLTWAICLLLTLDFQVLMLGARARRVYAGNNSGKRKIAEIILVIFIAAAISSVSVQMQSIIARSQATVVYTDRTGSHIRNLTIDEATRDMGIDPVALIWERSALVLVLIFMSGWFRDEEHQDNNAIVAQPTQAVVSTAQPLQSVIDYAQLAQAVAPLLVQALKSDVHKDAQGNAQPPMHVEEIAQASAQAAIAQHSAVHKANDVVHNGDNEPVHISQQTTLTTLHIVHPTQAALPLMLDVAQPDELPPTDEGRTVWQRLDEYYRDHGRNAPMPTTTKISTEISRNTVSRWRTRYLEVRESYEEQAAQGGAQ